MIRPIDANALLAQEKEWAKDGGFYTSIYNGFQKRIQDAPPSTTRLSGMGSGS